MNDQLVTVHEERTTGSLLLRLSGEIDLSNTEELHRTIVDAAVDCPLVIVDVSEVEYFDSQGVRLIVHLSSELAARNVKFELVAPPNTVARDVLDIVQLGDVEIRDALAG